MTEDIIILFQNWFMLFKWNLYERKYINIQGEKCRIPFYPCPQIGDPFLPYLKRYPVNPCGRHSTPMLCLLTIVWFKQEGRLNKYVVPAVSIVRLCSAAPCCLSAFLEPSGAEHSHLSFQKIRRRKRICLFTIENRVDESLMEKPQTTDYSSRIYTCDRALRSGILSNSQSRFSGDKTPGNSLVVLTPTATPYSCHTWCNVPWNNDHSVRWPHSEAVPGVCQG